MKEIDKHQVAERVRYYLREARPGGSNLEVLEDQIWPEEFAWHVPIQPDVEPKRSFEYYEILAEAMIELQDKEHISVYLTPVDSKADLHLQAA